MTKKHFIRLAIAIGGILDPSDRGRTARLIGEVCKENNSLFSWSKWYRACNVFDVPDESNE